MINPENKFNVQLHKTGVSVDIQEDWIDENLPGQINLSMDDLSDLIASLTEARLNVSGRESMVVQARDLQVDDILIESNVKEVTLTYNLGSMVLVVMDGHASSSYPSTQELLITRRIQ